MTAPFFGYAGNVWANISACMTYLAGQLATNTNIVTLFALTQATFNSVKNGLTAINANQYLAAWQTELGNLQNIQALPLNVDSLSLQYFSNRQSAINSAIASLKPKIPQPPFGRPSVVLPSGNPTIADVDLISWFETFAFEQPPSTASTSNFLISAAGAATAFTTFANAINTLQGRSLTQLFDTATRQSLCAQVAVNILNSFTSGPLSFAGSGQSPWSALFSQDFGPLTNVIIPWNQLVALPALILDANTISSAPYSLKNQQVMVIRFIMLSILRQLAIFLLTLRNPISNNVNLATVNQGDTLMDIAARTLNNFEQWTTIATLNNLQPPWISATSGVGVATPGQQILLPVQGSTVVSGVPVPSYLNNFLGIDYYLGPINQPMLPWSGDFQTIAGYPNLALSLGRRLQTTLGSLIYHGDYGSRIPPEVGTVQTTTEAGRIAAFGTSALLADPRVDAVLSATATIGPNGMVSFQGVVQPKGFGGQTIELNEVIAPAP